MKALRRILAWLNSQLERQTQLAVDDPQKISTHSKIIGAHLVGNIEVMQGAKITRGVRIFGEVKIGRFASINGPNTDIISSVYPVTIGNFTSIARNVSIQEMNHYFDRLSTYYMNQNIFGTSFKQDVWSKGGITIGNDVWIGTHCVVLSGVTIGNGAVIAANSVVASDIPPFCIAAGSPARVIKMRFSDEIIAELEMIQWWDWPIERIKMNKQAFLSSVDLDLLKRLE